MPSITGNPALGPIFPYPKTAVPSVTIADNCEVLLYTLFYLTSSRRIFSVNNGLILLILKKLSSICIFPKCTKMYLYKIHAMKLSDCRYLFRLSCTHHRVEFLQDGKIRAECLRLFAIWLAVLSLSCQLNSL